MKKKVFMLFILCGIFALASCNKGAGAPANRPADKISDELTAEYGLESLVRPATTIDKEDGNRYEIYVSHNAGESILVYQKDLTKTLKAHANNKPKLTSTVLSFADEIIKDGKAEYSAKFTDEEINKVLAVLNDVKKDANGNDYVVFSNLVGNLSFDYYNKENPTSAKLNLSTVYSLEAAVKAYSDRNTVYFTQVLLPVYVKRYYNSQLVLDSYLFIPLYATLNVLDGENASEIVETTDGYTLKAIDFGKKPSTFKFAEGQLLLLSK